MSRASGVQPVCPCMRGIEYAAGTPSRSASVTPSALRLTGHGPCGCAYRLGPCAHARSAHAKMSLINFSSLETVLKNVSEQQRTIAATLEKVQEEVATLATSEELSAQERILADG